MITLASTRAKNLTACLGLALFSLFAGQVSAQTNYYNANGTEYAVIGALPGDQVFPDVAISTTGGFLVWQDNITDGDGWGISARRLDSTLSGTLGTFRVNATGAGDQENPRVALLKNGGAIFVWQGGKPSHQQIYARFLTPSNTFLATTDLQVNTFNKNFQITPAVTVLNNSNVVVIWSSFNEAGSNSMQDVYGQILSPTGQKIGGEFLVNQQTAFNQRAPSVAAQPGGGFVVTWVSEQQRVLAPSWGTNSASYVQASSIITPSIDIYSRLYDGNGTALGNELLVNTDANPTTSPTVAVATDGSYLIAWTAHDQLIASNGFDIYGRTFSGAGSAKGGVFRINSHLYGDQYMPRVSAIGLDFLVSWTSLAQDGSREGVYAQFVHNDGSRTGGEFRVNTTTLNQQMHPAVASDGVNQFIVTWTSFTSFTNGFDLCAQRYVNASAVLQAMPAPYVWAPFVVSNNVYQPRLVVSWAPLLGLSVSNYEVYLDGSGTVYAKVISNQWTMTATDGLTTKSSHSFQLDYVLTDGRRAPISPANTGTTWSGLNWGGIPYEWMAAYFGGYFNGNYTTNFWPAANGALGPNMTLLQIFKSGGNPLDPTTWLKQQLARTPQGLYLTWNTQPGATYQVQTTTNFKTWNNVGSPRFAAGATDSIFVGGSPVGYYQIVLMR
ncbi:MAG TPA: hypothetical protein VG347_12690 [Verrucomicrobiae bacterium]|nr:hypothetical protein [Verrucomicrobiae bacterium]